MMGMHFFSRLGLVGTLGMTAVLVGAGPDDDSIPLDQVPRTVRNAIALKYPKALVQRVEEEQEHGRAIYDVDLLQDGRDVDLMVTPDGTLLQIEEEVTAADLPRAITDAVKARGFGTIRWAEVTTRGDRKRYEVIVAAQNRQLLDVELDADGTILDVDDE